MKVNPVFINLLIYSLTKKQELQTQNFIKTGFTREKNVMIKTEKKKDFFPPVFKKVFSENSVLMYGLYSRAASNQEWLMVARVQ
jgi:hypothetical protein